MKIKIGIIIVMFHVEQYGMDMCRGAEDGIKEYKGLQGLIWGDIGQCIGKGTEGVYGHCTMR